MPQRFASKSDYYSYSAASLETPSWALTTNIFGDA